ncbi:MAG: tRNA cytidylyltransferase [Anaeromyxobacter sp.]|nr:tRNA cytidylyltransferase [Anaeromyxobacter sp.]
MPPPDALRQHAYPPSVLAVLETLRRAGHRSYLVGGAVRDRLLGRGHPDADFDLATPARPLEVKALFPKVIDTGIAHGTVTVLTPDRLAVEVTTYRGEGAYLDGRRPTSVTFLTDLTEDLARRDFTINAMAWDPLDQVLVDPFGGQADLAARLIRAVGRAEDRFGEDGLRPLRAVRFAAQLGFALHPDTRGAIRGALPVVRKVSAERVGEELGRTVAAPFVEAALVLLAETGLLAVILPPLAALPAEALRHAGAVVAAVDPAAGGPERRLAALLHQAPEVEVEPLLTGLRFPRRVVEEAAALAARQACLLDGPPEDPHAPAAVRRWLAGMGPARAPALLALRLAEAAVAPPGDRPAALASAEAHRGRVAAALASGAPLGTAALSLDGRALMGLLGCPPGPHVGEGLRALLDEVLDDPSLDTPERLAGLARAWWARRTR